MFETRSQARASKKRVRLIAIDPETMRREVARWCELYLGARPIGPKLFEARHLSWVVGLRVSDRRDVVLKLRPASRRLHTCRTCSSGCSQPGIRALSRSSARSA